MGLQVPATNMYKTGSDIEFLMTPLLVRDYQLSAQAPCCRSHINVARKRKTLKNGFTNKNNFKYKRVLMQKYTRSTSSTASVQYLFKGGGNFGYNQPK